MNELIIDEQNIQHRIYTTNNIQFMLDSDLANIYGVETKRINEAVKNNPDKFPSDFYFELTKDEDKNLRSRFSTFKESLKNRKYTPKVFTEQGVYMLATVLKSKTATEISLAIIRAFSQMRKVLYDNSLLHSQFQELEKRQLHYEIKTDDKLETIFQAIEDKSIKPKQGIFYDGQTFDAYVFVADIIKSAKSSIILIDNFVDETVLMLLSKRASTCKATIYTKTISKQLQLDLKKHNEQYLHVEIKKFDASHDRFLIIDDKEIYHIGASLKDLGKKWFGFSKMESESFEMMGKLA